MKRTSSLNPVARALAQVLLILLMVASLFPLYNVLAASFKSEDEFVANLVLPPKAPMVSNYVHAAIDGLLLRFAVNTLILVPIGLVAYLAVCVTAGYAFGKMRFGPKRPLFLLVLFLMIFPQLLLATQVFRLISLLDLTNTGPGVILTWVAYFAPFGTYIMTTYFTDMPYELVEAARMDGATHTRILVNVMTPLAMPMIATIAIIGFQSMWNELPFSLLILQEPKLRTLTLGIAMMRGQYGLAVPMQSAEVVIASAVPLVIFLIFQRQVTLGITAGAIKG